MKKAKFGKVIFTLISSTLMLAVTPTVQYAATSMGDYLNITSNKSIVDVLGTEAGIYQTAINCSVSTERTISENIAIDRSKYGEGEEVVIRFSFSRPIKSVNDLKLGLKFGDDGTERVISTTKSTKAGWYEQNGSYIDFHYKIQDSDNGGLVLNFIQGSVSDEADNFTTLGINNQGAYWKGDIIAKGKGESAEEKENNKLNINEKVYILENNQIRNLIKDDISSINIKTGETISGVEKELFNNTEDEFEFTYKDDDHIYFIPNACDIAGNKLIIDGGEFCDLSYVINVNGKENNNVYYYKEGTQFKILTPIKNGKTDDYNFEIGNSNAKKEGLNSPKQISNYLYLYTYTVQDNENGNVKVDDRQETGKIVDTTAPTITWNYFDLEPTGEGSTDTDTKRGWGSSSLKSTQDLTLAGAYSESKGPVKPSQTSESLYLKSGFPKFGFTVNDEVGYVNFGANDESSNYNMNFWADDAEKVTGNSTNTDLKTENDNDNYVIYLKQEIGSFLSGYSYGTLNATVKVVDYAGNETTVNAKDAFSIIYDSNNPKIEITSYKNETNETNENIVNVQITAKDKEINESKIKEFVEENDIKVENGTIISVSTQNDNNEKEERKTYVTIMPAVDGYVSVYVPKGVLKDNCDNSNDKSEVATFLVDRTPPIINDVTGNPTDWTDKAKLSVIASDAGVGGIQYSFKKGNEGWSNYSTDNICEVKSNGTVYIKVKDELGNESEEKIVEVTKIDTTSPTITNIEQKQVSRYATELTIAANDSESGLAEYSFDGGNSWQTSPTKTYTTTTTIGKGKLRVKDRVGNITGHNQDVTVAIKGPTPIIKMENDGGNYVVPTEGDTAKIKTTVEIDAENKTTIYYAVSSSSTTEPSSYNSTETNKTELNIDMGEGTWYLWIYAKDNTLGLESEKYVSNAFVVKNSEITLTANPSGWTNQDVTVDVSYGEGLTENQLVNLNGTAAGTTTSVNLTENGTVYAEATDIAGNKVYNTLEINTIDKVAPEVTIDVQTQKYIISPTVESVDMNNRISVKEENLSTVEYTWTKENKEPTTWDNSFTAEQLSAKVADVTKKVTNADNGVWYLYAKATDLAGNSTIAKTGELIVKAAISFDTKTKGTCIQKVKIIDGVSYVIVAPGTTATNFLKYVSSPYTVAVKTSNSKETVSGNSALSTNELITVNNTDAKCIIVVKGDVCADGNINMSDILKLNKARLNKITLTKAEKLAGDVNDDSIIDPKDMIKLNQYRLGKRNEL